MRRTKSTKLFDFSGGLNTDSPVTSLELNQALDLQNINLIPSGGFQKRNGNTAFNSSAMVSSSTAISGIGYYRQSNGSAFLMSIAGTKIFKSDNLDGTMDDITGSVTITTGQDNLWTHSTLNNLSIFVGGAPDVPIQFNGTGNAAVLTGSPPSGNFGISANNRMFIGNTSSNPSRIYWSILGNPNDWTGTGSGSQDVAGNDGDVLIGAAIINTNHMLLFKQNSIHDLIITNAPFPVFSLFKGVGAISKRAIVNVDDMIYFITPQARMKATDGTKIYSFPDTIDNLWDSLNPSRLQYIHGQYYPKLRQIWWFCSTTSSTTHNYCIIWDLDRKAWLRNPTGFKMNSSVIAVDTTAYAGAYDGKIYKLDVTNTYSDASESGGIIDSYWRSGWIDYGSTIGVKQYPYMELCFQIQTSGNFNFGYGFNFAGDRKIETIPMSGTGILWDNFNWDESSWGGFTDTTKIIFIKGFGKFFQFLIQNNNVGEALRFNGIQIPIKESAPYTLRT